MAKKETRKIEPFKFRYCSSNEDIKFWVYYLGTNTEHRINIEIPENVEGYVSPNYIYHPERPKLIKTIYAKGRVKGNETIIPIGGTSTLTSVEKRNSVQLYFKNLLVYSAIHENGGWYKISWGETRESRSRGDLTLLEYDLDHERYGYRESRLNLKWVNELIETSEFSLSREGLEKGGLEKAIEELIRSSGIPPRREYVTKESTEIAKRILITMAYAGDEMMRNQK